MKLRWKPPNLSNPMRSAHDIRDAITALEATQHRLEAQAFETSDEELAAIYFEGAEQAAIVADALRWALGQERQHHGGDFIYECLGDAATDRDAVPLTPSNN
jgi:hypothetical protein